MNRNANGGNVGDKPAAAETPKPFTEAKTKTKAVARRRMEE